MMQSVREARGISESRHEIIGRTTFEGAKLVLINGSLNGVRLRLGTKIAFEIIAKTAKTRNMFR